MVFSSLIFLYAFLPLSLAVYALCRSLRAKNISLLVFSLIFYAWGEPVYVLLLMAMALFDWYFALRVQRAQREEKNAKLWVALACVVNLGLIGFFKYAGMVCSIFGDVPAFVQCIALPLGISFYTFQLLSYVVDVYRGDAEAQDKYWHVLLYAALFHQCIAGPIVRYKTIAKELFDGRDETADRARGCTRFAVGLAKKTVLANACGALADSLLLTDAAIGSASQLAENLAALSNTPALALWIGIIAYAFQIYFDFSAYSDMAIGMGQMIGLHYLENFNYPYISRTATEFWRRWHISLGTFFRDYVYIPLGGNRRGKARQILNLLAVWALTGLWHGASWNFVLWGLYFFVLLSIEKQIAPKLETLPFIVRNLVTMFFVLIGWVLFMNTSLSGIDSAFTAMFGGGTSFAGSGVSLQLKNSLPLLLTCLIGSSVLPRWFGFLWSGLFGMGRSDRRGAVTVKKGIYLASVFLFLILLLWLCTVSLVGSTSSPSMYAQF